MTVLVEATVMFSTVGRPPVAWALAWICVAESTDRTVVPVGKKPLASVRLMPGAMLVVLAMPVMIGLPLVTVPGVVVVKAGLLTAETKVSGVACRVIVLAIGVIGPKAAAWKISACVPAPVKVKLETRFQRLPAVSCTW